MWCQSRYEISGVQRFGVGSAWFGILSGVILFGTLVMVQQWNSSMMRGQGNSVHCGCFVLLSYSSRCLIFWMEWGEA
ncbi:hypothetical protein V6N13_147543 [Hibiscus sabdariffa]